MEDVRETVQGERNNLIMDEGCSRTRRKVSAGVGGDERSRKYL